MPTSRRSPPPTRPYIRHPRGRQGLLRGGRHRGDRPQDYILTPGRYVGIEEQADDGEPFEEKMARLTSELSDLFVKSHQLEAQIKEQLGGDWV